MSFVVSNINICVENNKEKIETIEISSISIEKSIIENNLDIVINNTLQSVDLRNGEIALNTLYIFESNKNFLKAILPPTFWVVHDTLFKPSIIESRDYWIDKATKIWIQFCLPLETDKSIDSKVRDKFYHSFPYILTQSIQKMFVIATKSNPYVIDKSFRLKICSIAVQIFTAIQPLEAHLESRFSMYFKNEVSNQNS